MSTHHHLKLQLLRLKPGQGWHAPREGLLFLFPKVGVGEFRCDSPAEPSVQSLTPGDVLVIQAGASGEVRAADEVELACCAFSVCFEHLFPIFMDDEIPLVQPIMDQFKTAHFYPATDSATVGWNQLIHDLPSEFDLEHRSQLLRVTAAILSEEFRKLRPPFPRHERADGRVSHLFEQLAVEQILSLSVTELAGRFSCSPRHLNRLFHQHFGLSVGNLRMELRLLKVVSLLRQPNFPIIQVAEECGFNHLGLFNACFKRRFGVSPGQWRKQRDPDNGRERALVPIEPGCRLRAVGLCPWVETPGVLQAETTRQELGDRS